MKIKTLDGGKLIILSAPFDSRPKILNCCYFLLYFPTAGICSMEAIQGIDVDEPVAILLGVLFGIGSIIVSYRFINKAIMREQLLVTEGHMNYIRRGVVVMDNRSFDMAAVSGFRLLDKPDVARHPLAGISMDYLGFQTMEHLIHELHGDNRLAFDYQGRTVKFGENIYSWDFEQILGIMKEYGYAGEIATPVAD